MTTDFRDLCARMAEELDYYRRLVMDNRHETSALVAEASATLARWGADQVSESCAATFSAARVGKSVPDAYRLVTKEDGNGRLVYVLQSYFTWTQGWSERGGEWRDLETQDWLTAQDDIPFGTLF